MASLVLRPFDISLLIFQRLIIDHTRKAQLRVYDSNARKRIYDPNTGKFNTITTITFDIQV